mgnify:CR=1 FL=1
MKYYKLKNDIPMFKKGDLFFIHPEEGCLLQKDTLRLAYHKKTLEKNPEILKDWFEEIEESKNKRWRGGRGDDYYFINDEGVVCHEIDTNDGMDNYRYNVGIYGRTKQELEAKLKYNVARQTLLDDAGGWKFTLKEQNYFAKYSVIDNRWHLNGDYHYTPGGIYFKDLESLKKSLKEHEEQWEIVRKYEMGEM